MLYARREQQIKRYTHTQAHNTPRGSRAFLCQQVAAALTFPFFIICLNAPLAQIRATPNLAHRLNAHPSVERDRCVCVCERAPFREMCAPVQHHSKDWKWCRTHTHTIQIVQSNPRGLKIAVRVPCVVRLAGATWSRKCGVACDKLMATRKEVC